MPLCNDIIKNRTIRFKLSEPDQAEKARQVLADVPGIEHLEVFDSDCLSISYTVEELTLQMIESALREVGFELDDSIVSNLKRAVFSYCEEALRASIGIDQAGAQPKIKLQRSSLGPRADDWRRYV